jgi:hypothetical protein
MVGVRLLTVRLVTGLAALGLVALAAAPAAAQAIRAAALAPSIKGAATTAELRDKFHDAVVRGLGSLNGPAGPNGELGEVITAPLTRSRLGEELLACGGTPACLPRAISALSANRIVTTELTITGKSYAMTLKLYDGQARELTHADDQCDICTVHEAEEAITKAASRLASVARTLPVGGTPPPPSTAPPAPTAGSSDTPPPLATSSPMQDNPTPPPVVARERRHVPWRALAFSSIGVGVIGVAVGVPLLVIDGKPTCSSADATHTCKRVYNTVGGGATLVALGGIGLLASVPLFYFDWRDRHQMGSLTLRTGVISGGGGLQLTGHF